MTTTDMPDSISAPTGTQAPRVAGFFDQETFTITYVVSDDETCRCAIIDSVLDFDIRSGRIAHASADRIVAYVREHALTVDWILETHIHADHLTAAPYIQGALGGSIGIGDRIGLVQETFADLFNTEQGFQRDGSQYDHRFADGETFAVGGLTAKAIHTPGHTQACMSYLIGDALFVGDVIFMPDYGSARCDFPGGDAVTVYRSVRRLFDLPLQTRMFVGHDYGTKDRSYAWQTTVAAQREGNIHLRDGVTEEEFVALRQARDAALDMPRLLLPAVQVNMRAGHLPPPEANGRVYLKLPVDAF